MANNVKANGNEKKKNGKGYEVERKKAERYHAPITREDFPDGYNHMWIKLIVTPDVDPITREYFRLKDKRHPDESETIPLEGEIVEITDSGVYIKKPKTIFPFTSSLFEYRESKKVLYTLMVDFCVSD